MKIKSCYSFLLVILVLGCSSFKQSLNYKGGANEVIQNAILDFSKTKLYKKDSIFYVSYSDTLVQFTLKQIDNRNAEWIPERAFKDNIALSIGVSTMKVLVTEKAKVGSFDSKIPTRFIENDGKLFYWHDKDYPLTSEALDTYNRYDLLQDDENGLIKVPDFYTDDSLKGAHYYFCRNDLTNYKRVITSLGLGYYDPPKLNCD